MLINDSPFAVSFVEFGTKTMKNHTIRMVQKISGPLT
jgi:hypothetical protein